MGSAVLHTRINALKAHINPNLEQENYHPPNKDPSFEEEDGDDDMKLMKSKKDMKFLRKGIHKSYKDTTKCSTKKE
jgi:hypothetical protein